MELFSIFSDMVGSCAVFEFCLVLGIALLIEGESSTIIETINILTAGVHDYQDHSTRMDQSIGTHITS
jgi:hypothetical protein